MSRNWIAGAALMAAIGITLPAFAQTATLPETAPPRVVGPVETYQSIETSKSIAPDGSVTDKIHSVEKSQIITDGNGELSARTHVEKSGASHSETPVDIALPRPLRPDGTPLP